MDGDTSLNDSLSLRRSTRHIIKTEKALETSMNGEDKSSSVKRQLSEESDAEMEPRKRGCTIRPRKTRMGRLKKFRNKRHRMSLRHYSGTSSGLDMKQERVRFSEPVRRSTREKRLVFATFNLQEMNKQMLNPAHDFPGLDSSDDDMDPYEKLLSPNRSGVVRRSQYKRGKEEGTSGGGQGEDGGATNEMEENGEEDDKAGIQEGSEGEDEEEESEEQSEEEEEDDEAGIGGYSLRKRRPVIYQYQPVIQVVDDDTPPKKHHQIHRRKKRASFHTKARSSAPRAYQPRKPRHSGPELGRKKHVQHHGGSSTTSSGSDSDEASFRRRKARSMARARSQCLPMNLSKEDVSKGPIRDRVRIGASLADVDPMTIDQGVTFDSIGGLQQHIRALKEMIIFPLLYPEVFDRFKIDPPRGVLFYGPPGCGKTLVARALANECSKGGKKVAFFMRKGADCLSKWVGESERQLRLLFDQAYQMRPSIIFFDEIDGLAPVRSSRQDQIHSSIVSTLLALMDGLDSRGEIVIIGATNRIDAIDPALRRPGRFDREFLFPLPSREDRCSILTIHTSKWDPPLKREFLSELADNTVGYCGADLKALCTESALHALRRKYPQIYKTTDKLMLDVESINVSASDFHQALKAIVPTAQRSDSSVACSLPNHMRPLLLKQFSMLLSQVSFVFPPAWKALCKTAKDVRSLLALEDEHTNQIHASLVIMKSAALLSSDSHTHHQASSTSSPSIWNDTSSRKSLSDVVPRARGTGRGVESPRYQYSTRQHHSSVEDWAGVRRPRGSGYSELQNNARLLPPRENLFNKLYRSSRPAKLDEIYFDTSDTLAGGNGEPSSGGGDSILIQPEGNTVARPTSASAAGNRSNETGSAILPSATTASESQPTGSKPPSSHQYLTLSSHPHTIPAVHCPRLILCGCGGLGQSSHLGPALLHSLEELAVKTLDLAALFGNSTKTPEEACAQIFREAKRTAPSILYIPRINNWWDVTTEAFRATLLSLILSLPPTTPLFLLATAECHYQNLPGTLKEIFRENSEAFTLVFPTLDERRRFFHTLLLKKTIEPPPPKPKPLSEVELDDLPLAPPPKPRELNQQELERIEKQREAVLRELRVFLRDATNKLLAERKFKEFVKPVDPEEVFDYYEIIKEPMDLGTIMKKIDEHRYTTPKQWISDVNLIAKNALEYNPEHDSESRLLRHRAVALQDMAHSFLDHELSEEFEKQCEEISETYRRIGKEPPYGPSPIKRASNGSNVANGVLASTLSSGSLKTELYNAPRRSLRQKGLDPDGTGLPYYSPPKPRLPRDESSSVKDLTDETTNQEEEEEEIGDDSPLSGPVTNGDMKGQSSSESMSTPKDGGSKITLKNVSVRRQIIRPWEDNKDQSSPALSSTPALGSSEKTTTLLPPSSVEHHHNRKTPLSESSVRMNGHRRKNSSISNISEISQGSYSVQTAAEALVEMGWSTPNSKEEGTSTEEEANVTMEVDKTHPVSVQEQLPGASGTNTSSLLSSDVVAREVSVSIDHEKLLALFDRVTQSTEKCTVKQLEQLHSVFEHLVFRYRMMEDRNALVKDLELATDFFLQSYSQSELS